MLTLGKPDRNKALAVDAKHELDLRIGVAFSRFQTQAVRVWGDEGCIFKFLRFLKFSPDFKNSSNE